MTILKSKELKARLKQSLSQKVTQIYTVGEQLMKEGEISHREYFRKEIFGELPFDIDDLSYAGRDKEGNDMVNVEFTITEELVDVLERYECLNN